METRLSVSKYFISGHKRPTSTLVSGPGTTGISRVRDLGKGIFRSGSGRQGITSTDLQS